MQFFFTIENLVYLRWYLAWMHGVGVAHSRVCPYITAMYAHLEKVSRRMTPFERISHSELFPPSELEKEPTSKTKKDCKPFKGIYFKKNLSAVALHCSFGGIQTSNGVQLHHLLYCRHWLTFLLTSLALKSFSPLSFSFFHLWQKGGGRRHRGEVLCCALYAR